MRQWQRSPTGGWICWTPRYTCSAFHQLANVWQAVLAESVCLSQVCSTLSCSRCNVCSCIAAAMDTALLLFGHTCILVADHGTVPACSYTYIYLSPLSLRLSVHLCSTLSQTLPVRQCLSARLSIRLIRPFAVRKASWKFRVGLPRASPVLHACFCYREWTCLMMSCWASSASPVP